MFGLVLCKYPYLYNTKNETLLISFSNLYYIFLNFGPTTSVHGPITIWVRFLKTFRLNKKKTLGRNFGRRNLCLRSNNNSSSSANQKKNTKTTNGAFAQSQVKKKHTLSCYYYLNTLNLIPYSPFWPLDLQFL